MAMDSEVGVPDTGPEDAPLPEADPEPEPDPPPPPELPQPASKEATMTSARIRDKNFFMLLLLYPKNLEARVLPWSIL